MLDNSNVAPGKNKTLRCAIYTRKSHEEGLEQEFNSLDAQRESAEHYIEAQRMRGWTALPDRYDDGGFSGGNMERPGLRRLLADMAEATMRLVVGDRSINEVISRRDEIAHEAAGMLQRELDQAETGGDADRALKQWSELAKRFSDWPQAWLSYGHMLLRTGNYEQALQAHPMFTAPVAANPKWRVCRCNPLRPR